MPAGERRREDETVRAARRCRPQLAHASLVVEARQLGRLRAGAAARARREQEKDRYGQVARHPPSASSRMRTLSRNGELPEPALSSARRYAAFASAAWFLATSRSPFAASYCAS